MWGDLNHKVQNRPLPQHTHTQNTPCLSSEAELESEWTGSRKSIEAGAGLHDVTWPCDLGHGKPLSGLLSSSVGGLLTKLLPTLLF